MKEQLNQDFLYNDVKERNKKMNKFYLPISGVIWALFLAFLWMKLTMQSTQEITPGYVYLNTALIVLFAAVNYIMYRRNKEDRLLCYMVLVEVALEVLLIGVKVKADFIFFALLAVLALQIPYYVPRLSK